MLPDGNHLRGARRRGRQGFHRGAPGGGTGGADCLMILTAVERWQSTLESPISVGSPI